MPICNSTVSPQFLSSPLGTTEWAIPGILPALVLICGSGDDLHKKGRILKEEANKRRGDEQSNEQRHVIIPAESDHSVRADHFIHDLGDSAADAVEELPCRYPGTLCARLVTGRTRSPSGSLVPLERGSGLCPRQPESSSRGSSMPAINLTDFAVRFVRILRPVWTVPAQDQSYSLQN